MKDSSVAPLGILGRLLNLILPSSEKILLEGDFNELYGEILENKGPEAAGRWIRRQCLMSVPRIVVRSLEWRFYMIVNFLKIALRNLERQRFYSGVNIIGLAAGAAAVLSIFLFIRHERSYDRFHARADRIYRLNTRMTSPGRTSVNAVVAPAVGAVLQAECPEIESQTRLFKAFNPVVVQAGDKSFSERRFLYVEPAFFDVFTFPLVEGNPRTALSHPGSLVLTRATARKYFPGRDALGRTLTVNDGQTSRDYIVSAIAADVPDNSHFTFDFLAPFNDHELSRVDNWFLQAGRCYLLLRPGASAESLERKFPPLIAKGAASVFGGEPGFREWEAEGNRYELFLQPLADIHLRSRAIDAQLERNGDVGTVALFGLIGTFILLVAVFNFINLATARSSARAGEVGVRKALGSSRSLLLRQFLTESVLMSVLALGLALGITLLAAPAIGALIGRKLEGLALLRWPVGPALVIGAIVVGVLAGLYPALRLASYKPVQILRGKFDIRRRSRLRGVLVIIQFALSILLLIVTLVVDGQIRFIRAKDLGYDKDNILALPASPDILKRYEAFRSELRRHPAVSAVSLSGYVPGRPMIGEEYGPINGDSEKRVGLTLMAGDEDLGDVLGLRVIQGRFFRRDTASDASAAVINETAARRLEETFHWDGPLGKTITNGRDPLVIVGIVKDFHFQSLRRKVDPLAIVGLPPNQGPFIAVRARRGAYPAALALTGETWKTFAPGQPFEPAAFGREIDGLYGDELRAGRLLSLFTFLAIGLGCLGLLGIAVFLAERRTKEIGIRRVLGASAGRLVLMLVRQSAGWVLAANLIAWPAAFFIMSRWLEGFAYRTRLHPAAFILSGGAVLLIACATVGVQALRAASADPVDALKYE